MSHLTPSSLSPSHGCQSHNEQPSISCAWLTHFDSWESLGPVRSKLPLSKCHHQHIHQPKLWICPFSFSSKKQKQSLSQKSPIFPCLCFACAPPSDSRKAYTHSHTIIPLNTVHTNACSHWWPSIAAMWYACRLSVIGRGSSLLLLMGLWAMNSVSPRCW